MDAAPQTGYIIWSHGLGGGSVAVWNIVGGTSAAAPLMAGITADTNESAGGANLGFANPFIYQEADGDFHDITQGNNSNGTGSSFQAGSGFDMVTGRGSRDRQQRSRLRSPASRRPSSHSTRRSSPRPTRPT